MDNNIIVTLTRDTISNLIAEMTIQGIDKNKIAKVVECSKVIIDALKEVYEKEDI